jgi:hypothetical protein
MPKPHKPKRALEDFPAKPHFGTRFHTGKKGHVYHLDEKGDLHREGLPPLRVTHVIGLPEGSETRFFV